jgi:sulfofructose kinase
MSKATPPPTHYDVDVLCVGLACYDLIFTVDHHPGPNEKARASAFMGCGGGTAANAAVAAARLGASTAFIGYLGTDIYGDQHLAELNDAGVDTRLVVRGKEATSLSAIFVKPDGARSIVNYREAIVTRLTPAHAPFAQMRPKVILFDGHQPALAVAMAKWARDRAIPTVLDADTVNEGHDELVRLCTILAASERFSQEFTGADSPQAGMTMLAQLAPAVVVTLGERGLIWQRGAQTGALPAFPVKVVDTTGAGDAFHGALAAGVAQGMEWEELLRFASAAGALCCTRRGARPGLPSLEEVRALLQRA